MNRFVLTLFIISISISGPVFGQVQKETGGEFFLGYTFNRMDRQGAFGGEDPGFNLNGVNLGLGFHLVHTNVTDTFGLVTDVGALFGTIHDEGSKENVQIFTAALGPQFTNRSHKYLQPYVRALFGASYVKGELDSKLRDDLGFAFIGGGGVDLKLSDNFAYRIIQLDYMLLRHNSININNFRVATGITVLF